MKPGSAEKPLHAFIDALSLDDLRDCLPAYFNEDKYVQQRRRSLAVFLRLAMRAVGKDVYYA